MRILGIDTTGQSLSVALSEGTSLIGEVFLNNGKKHSETLMPAIDYILKTTGCELQELNALAVTVGPGSFTGIRIGVAAAEALAYAAEKPLYAVSTLDALMENAGQGVVCAAMDARRGEVYAAARSESGVIVKECALPLEELLDLLKAYDNVVFVGDGAVNYKDLILQQKPDSLFLKPQFMLQRASSVCMCAYGGRAEITAHNTIKPRYLRESQAERLRRMK